MSDNTKLTPEDCAYAEETIRRLEAQKDSLWKEHMRARSLIESVSDALGLGSELLLRLDEGQTGEELMVVVRRAIAFKAANPS